MALVEVDDALGHREAVEQGESALVQLEGVNKWYGANHVLKDVNLRIKSGEVVVVLGASGSGKTTMCRTINRLETIDSGRVLIEGQPLPVEGRELRRVRAEVGMVFQSFNLFSHKTALENITLAPIKVRKQTPAHARERANELLARVGLSGKGDRLPAQLSGGEQQRVAIARALAMDPKVMLFDEPTSSLDIEMVKEVLDVMAELVEAGMTMVVVTHQLGFARSAADRIVFMADGAILEEAPPAQFFDSPSTERAKTFLSKIIPH